MLLLVPLLLLGILSDVLTLNKFQYEEYNLEEAENLFNDFIKKMDKKYETKEEHDRRLLIFKNNLKRCNEFNKDSTSVVLGITSFSDMTPEEFGEMHSGCAIPSNNTDILVEYIPIGVAPDSLDWRTSNLVTPVKDQGNCGSCFVFSAIGNIEGQFAKLHNQLISLSEQQALDCSPGTCDGGNVLQAIQALAQQGGSMREGDDPYQASKGQCSTDSSKIAVRVTGGNNVLVANEEALKDALYQYGPLSTILKVNYYFIHQYTSGIASSEICQGTSGNHAILIVGYGSENGTPYWIVKNSWGVTWGEQGYFRIQMGQNVCNFGLEVHSAFVT